MTAFTYPVGNLATAEAVIVDKILITMDMSTPSTAGINTTFTGSLNIDWKEGGGVVPFTSGVELTHTYTTPGTYIAEITGDLVNITKFLADTSKITNVQNFKTGLLAQLNLTSNLFAGVLDLSASPVSSVILLFLNSGLTGITFASSGNGTVINFQAHLCGLIGILNLDVITSATVYFNNNPGLTGVNFKTGSHISNFRGYFCNLTGVVDFSNITMSGLLSINNNSLLTGLNFATSGNSVFKFFTATNCNLTGILDLSNNPISSSFNISGNSLLTGITFASSGNGTITALQLSLCNLTGTLDLSNVPISTFFSLVSNPNLTGITFSGSGNGVITSFFAYSCSLTNIDFSVFPTSDNSDIRVYSNSFTATEHDNQLINLDVTGWINGTLNIITGNTARTSASDTAYNNLIANGWTIT